MCDVMWSENPIVGEQAVYYLSEHLSVKKNNKNVLECAYGKFAAMMLMGFFCFVFLTTSKKKA